MAANEHVRQSGQDRSEATRRESTMVVRNDRPNRAPDARAFPGGETETASFTVDLPAREWARRLSDVLEDRMVLLRDLESTSARQEEAIGRRDPAELMELVAGRQSVVDRFVAGQPELLELTQSFAERVGALPEADAAPLRAGMRRISEGLARIAASDDLARQALRAAREDTRVELERMSVGADARAAYGPTPRAGAVFADRKA